MHAAPESPCAVGLDDQIWQNQSAGTLVRPWKRTGVSDRRKKCAYVIHFFTLHEFYIVSLSMGVNLQRQLSWASSLVRQYHLSHSPRMSWCHRCWRCKDLMAEDITVTKQPTDWPSNYWYSYQYTPLNSNTSSVFWPLRPGTYFHLPVPLGQR